MSTRKNNICKKLNWLAFALSLLVFVFSGLNVAMFMLSGSSVDSNSVFGVEGLNIELVDRINESYKGAMEASVSLPDIKLTMNEDGSYGEIAILECLEILRQNIINATSYNEEAGQGGYGYSIETFGAAVAVPDTAADMYTVKQNVYEFAQQNYLGEVFKEAYEVETSKTGKGRNAGDRTFYSNGTIKTQTTGNVSLNGQKIVGNYSGGADSRQSTQISAWDIPLDKNFLKMNACSLAKEGSSYKLTLSFNRNATKEMETLQENKGGARKGSCEIYEYVANIYLTKKGKIAYIQRKTVSKMYVLNIINTWVTTTINNYSFFTEFKQGTQINKF